MITLRFAGKVRLLTVFALLIARLYPYRYTVVVLRGAGRCDQIRHLRHLRFARKVLRRSPPIAQALRDRRGRAVRIGHHEALVRLCSVRGTAQQVQRRVIARRQRYRRAAHRIVRPLRAERERRAPVSDRAAEQIRRIGITGVIPASIDRRGAVARNAIHVGHRREIHARRATAHCPSHRPRG